MTTTKKARGLRRLGYLVCAGLTVTAAAMLSPSQLASAATGANDGIVCEANGSSTFDLDATDSYIGMPDGNSIYMWSYSVNGHAFQFPGPTLCVRTGDTVTVTLHNHLAEDTSIVFNGQTGVLADSARPSRSSTGPVG